jgi:hypothetical protein
MVAHVLVAAPSRVTIGEGLISADVSSQAISSLVERREAALPFLPLMRPVRLCGKIKGHYDEPTRQRRHQEKETTYG